VITAFNVRKASDSRWIRKEDNDWMRAPRSKNAEQGIGVPNVHRSAFGPVGELLICNPIALPEVGRALARWLDEQKNVQTTILDWLSHRAGSGLIAGRPIGDHNRIGAIEILARYSHWSAPHLIDRYLSEPIREFHLYAMPLARLQQVNRSPDAKTIAGNIIRLYNESRNYQPSPRWRERFTVEAFRTLAELSPADVVGPMASDLTNVADFELTTVLDSVSLAARKFDRHVLSHTPLKTAVESVWKHYLEDRSTGDIGNRPGIMGRLIELVGRVGEDLDPFFAALNDHPLRMQILYQFTRRPLDFASVDNRFRWYADVLKAMVEAKQSSALKKFLTEVVFPDMPQELQKTIIGTLTKKNPERPTTS
jgi:hypothetical protein